MFLHSVSPTGAHTSIDLSAIPVWRLEISAKAINQGPDQKPSYVALMFAYSANVPSGTSRITIAAVDTKTPGEAEGIAGPGLPYLDLEQNRRRLHEAAKALFNVEAIRKEADVIAAKISQLADLYHAILDAMGAKASDGSLSAVLGPPLKGELEGWKFAVTRGRFDPWRGAQNTFKPANGPAMDLGSPMAPAAPANAPSMGTPPTNNAPPPPPPKAPSREARRRAEANSAAPAAPAAPVAPAATLPAPPTTPEDPPVLQVEDDT